MSREFSTPSDGQSPEYGNGGVPHPDPKDYHIYAAENLLEQVPIGSQIVGIAEPVTFNELDPGGGHAEYNISTHPDVDASDRTATPREVAEVKESSELGNGAESSSDHASGFMTITGYLLSVERAVRESLDEIRQLVEGIGDLAPTARESASEVAAVPVFVAGQLDQLKSKDEPTRRQASLAVTVAMDALPSKVRRLKAMIYSLKDQASDPVDQLSRKEARKAEKSIFRELLETIKRAIKMMWELICNLSTPKEWTFKMGVRAIAGAEIEIKFGE